MKPNEIQIPTHQPQAPAGANALTLVLCAIAMSLLPFLASARPTDDAQTPTNSPNAPAVATTNATTTTPVTSAATNAATPSDAGTNAEQATAASTNASSTNAAAESTMSEEGTNGFRMNFRNAPLDLVLDSMAKAAGFIINKETPVSGTVDIVSKEPVTKDEAVELLFSALKKNGYSLVRNGRILDIIGPESAKYRTPIEQVTWPNTPKEDSDEMVTEIIPVRYANVTQLEQNLQVLLPTTATLTPNESANSLILTATRTDIRRMLQIINALDTSIASVSSIRVFLLKYEDAKDLATLITQLFTPQTANQGPGGGGGGYGRMFRMFGGGGFPGGGGAPGGGSGSGNGAVAKNVQAVGDERANALIVTAPSELLETIAQMVDKIDQPVSDITQLRVFAVKYADPTDLANQITSLYPDDTTTGNQSGGLPFFFGRFGGGPRPQANQPDERARKLGRVLAVPEPRTKKLMVTAPNALMPQIAEMIESLDVKGQQEIVGVYDLENADPQDVEQALTDLFNRSSVRMNSSSTKSSMLGQNNPLTQRETQQQQNLSTTSALGTSGGAGRGGGFGQ